MDKNGRIYNIQTDLVPAKILAKSDKSFDSKVGKKTAEAADASAPLELSAEEAVELAFAATGVNRSNKRSAVETEFVYFPHEGLPTPAWKVVVASTSGRAGEWKVYVDAVTSDIMKPSVSSFPTIVEVTEHSTWTCIPTLPESSVQTVL